MPKDEQPQEPEYTQEQIDKMESEEYLKMLIITGQI